MKNQKGNRLLSFLTEEEKSQFLEELLELIDSHQVGNSCKAIEQCIESWQDIAELNSIPGLKQRVWKKFNQLKADGKVS